MFGFTPILAEYADKEPALSTVFAYSAFVSLLTFVLCLWRPWGVLLAIIPVAYWIGLTFDWPPEEKREILQVLGQSYLTQFYIAGCCPALAAIVGFLVGLSIQRRKHVVA
jgi:hypothetical protein